MDLVHPCSCAPCLGWECASAQLCGQPRGRWRSPRTNLPGCSPAPDTWSVALAPCGAPSIPSCRCWHPGGRAVSPPACCRSALGASAGFYLPSLSRFPALFCGQGSLLLLCSSVLSPHFIPGDEGCSSGSCSVPPLRFAGICGQQCWSRQRALLCTDRQMCCVHPEPSQGNMESRCWTGTCWRSAGPSLPPVPLWSGLESGALQGSGELGAALAALAERNVCLCGVRSVEKQPGVTLHRS